MHKTLIVPTLIACSGAASTAAVPAVFFNSAYDHVLGTSLGLKVGTANRIAADRAQLAALKEIDRLSRILSSWDQKSEFTQWARSAGQAMRVSPENKALIMRTQIERWITANRARLSPAQLQVMQEMAAVVSPDLYSPNRTEGTLARVQELEKRAISLLGKEDVGRAATLEMAVYIPKAQ